MNSAVPIFFGTGSGIGLGTIGCIAGTVTVNSAIKGVPFIRIAFPFFVNIVLFIGVKVTEIVPIPGVTKGGEVYGIGAISVGGNSSPSRQAGILITIKSELVPINGIGGINIGTTAGGKMVNLIISPVLIMKSAGILFTQYRFLGKHYTHYYIIIMILDQDDLVKWIPIPQLAYCP